MHEKFLTFSELLSIIKLNLKDEYQIPNHYGFNCIGKPLNSSYRAKYYVSDSGIPFLLSASRNLETRIKIMSYLIS